MARPTVVIVDDCEDTLMLLRYRFEEAGAQVFTAGSGKEALDLFGDSNSPEFSAFNLLVVDMRMPKMQGPEVAAKFRELGFKGKIVALTAAATGEGRGESLKSGIDVYLSKIALKKEVIDSLVQEASSKLA